MHCRTCGTELPYRKMMCVRCGDLSPNYIESVGGAGANEVVKEDDFIDAFDVEASLLERIVTDTPCDECWGGGFVPSSITLIGGPPGGGKTSLLIYLAKRFAAKTGKPAYLVSAEQDKGEIKIALNRFWPELQPGMLRLLKKMGAGGTLDEAALDKVPPGMLILDSISALCGNDKLAQIQVGKRYKQYAVKYKAPTFIIAHMTKESDFAGLMTLQHDVDVLVTVFPEDDGPRTLKAWKNRFGPTHKEYKLLLTEHGYEAVPEPEEKKGKRGKVLPMPPPVTLIPRDEGASSASKSSASKDSKEKESKAKVIPIGGFKPASLERPPPLETITTPEGQRLVRRVKKPVGTTLLKEPLTATVKEVAAKSREAQATAIEGEAVKRKRPAMPRTPDLKAKATSNRKTKDGKGREAKKPAARKRKSDEETRV
jgi:hypothetical protein